MPTTKHWTSKDLETLPSTEGTRYEIIAGELFVSTQPHWHHQYTCGRLFRALDTWSDTHPLGAPSSPLASSLRTTMMWRPIWCG